jgi:hypothetical protein
MAEEGIDRCMVVGDERKPALRRWKKERSTNPIIYNTGSDIVLLSVETLTNQDMHMGQVLN